MAVSGWRLRVIGDEDERDVNARTERLFVIDHARGTVTVFTWEFPRSIRCEDLCVNFVFAFLIV